MMNNRITLQRREEGEDTLGQPTVSWADLPAIWAHVKFQSGAEAIRANADSSVVKASIRIRQRKDVDASMRVKFKEWVFEIKAPPMPDDRDPRFAFLVCEATK